MINQNNQVDYSHIDHSHCWTEKNPPCGQKIKHFECCLCKAPHPDIEQTIHQEVDKMKKLMLDSLPEEKETICFCGELLDKNDAHGYHDCGAFVANRRGFSKDEEEKLNGYNQALREIKQKWS